MHPARLYGGFWTIFFSAQCSSRLEKKKDSINNLIHGGGGGVGNTWGHNFYMGTQNGSKLEI